PRRPACRSARCGTRAPAGVQVSPIPPATASSFTTGTSPMSRNDALSAYEALPLPDTTEEHWRFTDLRGFDPETFAGAASADIETLLDLDVAGYATVTADGIEIAQAPEGVIFAPLPEAHERLYSLVGWDEKFAAHNAAMWKHGLLVVIPKGVVLEKPLYVRIAVTGQTFWRLVVAAEEGARGSLIEEYASPAADTSAYSNAVTELFVEPNAKLEYVSLQNLSTETWHFASHHARVERDAEPDWGAGGSGSKRGKAPTQNDLNGSGAPAPAAGADLADGTQLFYLMTRGLPRAEAERMVVRGFFQNVLDRIELEPVREAVTAALEARIPQA